MEICYFQQRRSRHRIRRRRRRHHLLNKPAGAPVSVRYGAVGVGLTVGLKLPRIGKLAVNVRGKSVGGVIAPACFPNTGKLYVLDSFPGNELTRSNLTGVCMFAEVGAGLIVGGSGTAMVLGMSAWRLAPILACPALMPVLEAPLLESATAILLMDGINAGIQAGGAIAGFVGELF